MEWDRITGLAQDRTLWAAALALVAFVLLPIWIMLPAKAPLKDLKTRLGLTEFNSGLFILAALLWLGLFLALALGLFWLVIEVLTHPVVSLLDADGERNTGPIWDWRFKLVQITALTAVLGAVVTLPVTLNRLRLQREANRTADESLFNQKITEAAADLHARRQRTMRGIDGSADVWEDDVVRRNAAINRLEGLVEERMRAPVEDAAKRDVLSRVSRLLSVYVRELSKEVQPVPEPTSDRSRKSLRAWARRLQPRSDMENAAQTLGRLRGHAGDLTDAVEIDLQGANLQGCRLAELDFTDSTFREVRMQGVDLSRAQMQRAELFEVQMQAAHLIGASIRGADLAGAQMQGALLFLARMQGARLVGTSMQGANFSWAKMQGADLRGAQIDKDTKLRDAALRGAALSFVDDTTVAQMAPFLDVIFSDGTIAVPDGQRPEHWADAELESPEFEERWRAWQRSIGMDPENPE